MMNGCCYFFLLPEELNATAARISSLRAASFDLLPLADVYSACRFGFETRIKKMLGVTKSSAFEKVQFYMIFENAAGNNIAFIRPYRDTPLPFFSDFGSGLQYQVTELRNPLSAPVRELC